MNKLIRITVILSLFGVYCLNAQKVSNFNNQVHKLSKPINFDGQISKGEWDAVTPLPLVSHWPEYNEKPNGKTLYYIAYDDTHLYFAANCFGDPSQIQKPSFERDEWSMVMDNVALFIDSYNDNENASIFSVTATGSRIDVSVINDAQGDAIDTSWNSFWEAKVSESEDGWMVEAKIPFSSLRYQTVNGEATMGISAYRYKPKDREMDIFPKIKPEWGFWSFAKPSQAYDMTFKIEKNKRPWITSPYALTSTGYYHQQESDISTPEKKKETNLDFGLDVQHAITNNLNLDLSLNTDFAQVEADDQIVNLNRFSLFFPEKRRFFLERAGIMDFRFDNSNRIFYSRRIGIREGKIVPLWGGARLVGRISSFDVGIMNMQSQETDDFTSENFGVYRLRKKIGKTNSYIGGILTTRSDFKGANNFAYGIDGVLKIANNDYLKVNFATTNDSDEKNEGFLKNNKRIYALWENRSTVGFNYAFGYSQVDPGYQAGLGFEERTDFLSGTSRFSYGWLTDDHSTLRNIDVHFNSAVFQSKSLKQLESYSFSPSVYVGWKKANYLEISYNHLYDKIVQPFSLSSDVEIPIKEYRNDDITIGYSTPQVNYLTAEANLTLGTFYDGKRVSFGISPTYTISKYLTLNGSYQYNQIRFDFADYKSHIGRIKASTSLNTKLSLNAFVQFNSLNKSKAINVRLRYNSKDGNDLYIVYNESLNGEFRDLHGPKFYSDFQYFTVKYVHTMRL